MSAARVLGAASLPRRGETNNLILRNGSDSSGFAIVRGAKDASWWEIEHLLVEPGAHNLCMELVPQLDRMLRPRKGTTIFLRVLDADPLAQSVSSAGFRPYMREDVFVRSAGDRAPREIAGGIAVRALSEPPDFQLFRIHTASSPVEARAADGMTLRDWQESLATRWIDVRKTKDIVASRNGADVGWARFGQVGGGSVIARCAVMSDNMEAVEALIESVIQLSDRSHSIMFLVPSRDAAISAALASRGFHTRAAYRGFAYQMGRRVVEGAFAAAQL